MQLFRSTPPIEIIWELLELICIEKTTEYFIVNYESYRRLLFLELETYLYDKLIQYYHPSRTQYLEKELNYKRMLTIIRQVCSVYNVPYTYYTVYEGGYQKPVYKFTRIA
jgi:hypothetical protein